MLKHRSHSLSILNLQKSLSRDLLNKLQTKKPFQSVQSVKSVIFVPFCKERRLGKIIQIQSRVAQNNNKKFTDTQLLQIVNFKNFKKMYNGLKKIQNQKYAILTRNPQQKNMFNPIEWKPSTQVFHKKKSLQLSNTFEKAKSKLKKFRSVEKLSLKDRGTYNHTSFQNKFQKIDVQLYKKLSSNRPPESQDPQLNNFFQNYVMISQMNQNLRRERLISKQKQFYFE